MESAMKAVACFDMSRGTMSEDVPTRSPELRLPLEWEGHARDPIFRPFQRQSLQLMPPGSEMRVRRESMKREGGDAGIQGEHA